MNHVEGEFQVKKKAGVAEGPRSTQTSATRESIELCVPQPPLEPEIKRKSISMVGIIGSTLKLEPAANSAADCTSELEPQPGLRPMHGHIASSAAAEIVPEGSTISNDNISYDRNLKRLTSVSVHTVGSKRSSSSTYITARSIRSSVATFETATSGQRSINRGSTLSRSSWYNWLKSKDLIPEPLDEKDWSGRGEHAEFQPNEASKISELLVVEERLGHSASALVESVRCRRLLLARKTIYCNRQMKRTDAIREVQQLKRSQHSHVVQVIGTYTFKQDLAILLYPAAEFNLETFMESILAESPGSTNYLNKEETQPKLWAMVTFFSCLSRAINFLHSNATKHMDIKPKNLLIKYLRYNSLSSQGPYKIYIADFGITRSYKRAADAETDSPTSFTRLYAAPEVVDQRKRGLSADIFSLGCVFAEMLAVLAESDRDSKRKDLLAVLSADEEQPRSYHGNIPLVAQWLRETNELNNHSPHFIELSPLRDRIWQMIDADPLRRPSADTVVSWLKVPASCCFWNTGPDPFSAESLVKETEGSEENGRMMNSRRVVSLYHRCVALQERLSRVPDLDHWREDDNQSNSNIKTTLGPATSLWQIFRQGIPLVKLYNALDPARQIAVKTDLAEEQKAYGAVDSFLNACEKDPKIDGSLYFRLSDLFSDDVVGFTKVFKLVDHILDLLDQAGVLRPEHVNSQIVVASKPIPQIHKETGFSNGNPHLRNGSERARVVDEFVSSEREYVQDLEVLYSLNEIAEKRDIIPNDDARGILTKLHSTLEFQCRLLLRIEQVYALPEHRRNWTQVFYFEGQALGGTLLRCLNDSKGNVEVAVQNLDEYFTRAGAPVELLKSITEHSHVISSLLRPAQRLVRYRSFLMQFRSTLALGTDENDEMTIAIEVLSKIIRHTSPVVAPEKLADIANDLVRRVELQGMCVEDYGKLILHGTFQVQKDVEQRARENKIYLFEFVLFFVLEEFPSRIRLCRVVRIKRITGTMSLRRSGHYVLQIFPEAANFKFLAIRFTTDEMMREWESQIDAQRQEWKELATSTFTFFRNASGMPVSNLHAQEYFSSDDDVDEEDDIMTPLPEL